MILDLREYSDFPAIALLEAGPGEFEIGRDDVPEIEKVRVNLTIQRAGEEYYCRGQVTGLFRIECARCLVVFPAELTNDTDFIIRSDASANSRESRVTDDEDYVYLKGDDLRADVTFCIRQALALAVPIKPLCDEDCRGLCATCGADLNEAACDCSQERFDGRWEGLSGLARK